MARFSQGSGSSNNGGAALNYVQVVGTQQVISSAPNAIVDLSITTTGAPVQISVTGEGANASAGSWLRLNLFRDNVEIGNAIQLESSAASENVPFAINFIDDVAAGTYNYSARVTSITGGNWTFGEAAGPVINAVELTGFEGNRGPRGFKGDQGEPGAAGADGADGAGFEPVLLIGPLRAEPGPSGPLSCDNISDAWTQGSPVRIFPYTSNGIVSGTFYEGTISSIDSSRTEIRFNGEHIENPWTNDDEYFEWQMILAGARGIDGSSSDIADFVFSIDEDGAPSRMTVTDHDMTIQTVRVNDEPDSDCDINIEAADDVFIRAIGDEIGIYADSSVTIRTNNYDDNGDTDEANNKEWQFQTDGGLRFPDNTVQTTAYIPQTEIVPLPDFLTYVTGRSHLPTLNTNFGWDSSGVWFRVTNDSEAEDSGTPSYPVFTDFVISESTPTQVAIDVEIDDHCSDMGICIYLDGTTPEWAWGTNPTRIAAQFNCPQLEVWGASGSSEASVDVPSPGTYTMGFLYDPTSETNKVTVAFGPQGSSEAIAIVTLNEALPSGNYRIGFAADMDSQTEKTYMSNLSINVGSETYTDTLTNGNSGAAVSAVDLVVPVSIVDGDGDDFITFTRTSTGTARIETPQDDLSLRSARDITLFAGSEGPGNVYIGWGDATITPDANNRVATIGDIQNANTGDITFVESTISNDTGDDIVIQNKNDDGIVKARITLDQSNEQVLIEAIGSDSEWFNNTQWSTAVWSGSVVTITETPDIINFFNNALGNVNRVSINDGGLLTYEGAGYGSGNITINVGGTPPEGQDPLTVTEIRFYYELVSEINIDHDDSEFNIISRGMSMTIDSSGELELKARNEDLHLYANDDVRFTTNWDNNGTEYSWRMSESGKFELPGDGYIQNPTNSSSDNGSSDTIKIVPDADLIEQQYHEDQFLVIDPTGPNHIHLRAGGEIDSSSADLILGGERTNVRLSDTDGTVYISSKRPDTTDAYVNGGGFEANVLAIVGDLSHIQPNANFSVDVDGTLYQIDGVSYNSGTNVTQITASPATFVMDGIYTIHESNGENYWSFTNNGYLNGPAMGGLLVSGILNANGDLYVGSSDDNVSVTSGASINLNANNAVRVTTNGGDSAWDFSIDGKLYGPGEDGALILGGELLTTDINMSIRSTQQSVVLNGQLGEFLGSSDDASSQIATIGDVNAARFGASASFFSTVDQGPNAANAIQAFTFNNSDWLTGVTLVNSSQVTVANAGKYNIAFSAQMHQTNGSGIVNIWLNKNGTPLANSNTKFAITANNPFSVAALNLFVDAAAGDSYQLMWSSDSNNTVMEYEAATGSGATLHPAVPSVILTINQVG